MIGLPFHSHGESWLAVLYGRKTWHMYSPGTFIPLDLQQKWNPLLSVSQWIEINYHIPVNASYAAINNSETHNVVSASVYPSQMEGTQHSGDILYVPSGWSHMTMNQGTKTMCIIRTYTD
jgi:hypothetical protein